MGKMKEIYTELQEQGIDPATVDISEWLKENKRLGEIDDLPVSARQVSAATEAQRLRPQEHLSNSWWSPQWFACSHVGQACAY
jgi:hypothetical protein